MNRSPPDRWAAAPPPSLDDIAALAEAAFADLPQAFRVMAGEVLVRVEDFAEPEVLDALGIEDPFELTGLYQGLDLASRSILGPAPAAPMVFLYRRPILDEWADHGDIPLGELVAHVLVHEIGHHFGLSDDDIEKIEAE